MSLLEFSNLVLLVGAGIAGSASLWGAYFSVKCRNNEGQCSKDHYTLLARMLAPMVLGVLMTILGWYFSLFAARRLSFAGLQLTDIGTADTLSILEMQFLPVIALVFITLIGFAFIRTPSKNTWWEFEWMYVFNFLATLALIFAPMFVLEGGEGFSLALGQGSLIFATGTVGIILFQFYENRKAEIAKLTYKNFKKMYGFIFGMLGIFITTQLIDLNGMLMVTVPLIFQEMMLIAVILLLAWASGPLQDGLEHVHRKFKILEVRNPEDNVITFAIYAALIWACILLLVSFTVNLTDFTLLKLTVLFLVIESAALFAALSIGYKIIGKDQV